MSSMNLEIFLWDPSMIKGEKIIEHASYFEDLITATQSICVLLLPNMQSSVIFANPRCTEDGI